MPTTDPQLLLGHLAVHYELLTKEQVAAAWRRKEAAGDDADFARVLVEAGFLPEETVRKLLRAREYYVQRQAGAEGEGTETTGEASAPTSPEGGGVAAAAPKAGAATAAVDVIDEEPAAAAPKLELDRGPAGDESDERERLGYRPGIELESLLRRALEIGASDLHLHSGAPLQVRLHGELVKGSTTAIDGAEAERLVTGLLPDELRAALDDGYQLDFVHTLAGAGRFRGNAYRQRRGLDAVFRAIPSRPPRLEELGLPPSLERLTEFAQGVVLFTGPAGCGKSSTMAAMVDLLNARRAEHIITIEDPIEYLHPSKRCVVNQRQVGRHTESFPRALRAALREDPDVIVIGELRDLESVSLALRAAETGHLVMGTLHTSSAVRTVNRILGVFPPAEQAQIRTMVSESLRGVVSQRLLRRADGEGRVPAVEVLLNTKAIGNLIRENKTFQIPSVMQTGTAQGMCLLDASLAELVKAGRVSREEARRQSADPKRFS